MKTILFDRSYSSASPVASDVEMIADSAITLFGRPVFLPDFDTEWQAWFYLAVRISRLGKNIAEKFAPRYFDALTLAMRLVPVSLSAAIRETGRHDCILSAFDYALTLGRWEPVDNLGSAFEITVGDKTLAVSDAVTDASVAVADVSRYATVKTGDIIMPYRVLPPVPVCVGLTVKGRIGDRDCFDARIR